MNYIKKMIFGFAITSSSVVNAQKVVSDFEGLALDSTGYWNGSDLSGGFIHGLGYFENSYDTAWSSWFGFSYSNLVDNTTAGWTNQYSTFAGSGYNGSNNFAVMGVSAYEAHEIKFGPAQLVNGFYVTNTTYAALSMRDGDAFAKAFGADTLPDGSDTTYTGDTVTTDDWFKLTIYGVVAGVRTTQFEEIYLADYRYADDAQDYIVDDWRWLDLTSLGEVDALQFELTSTDNGAWGMNTPAYFCMDDLTIGVDDSTNSKSEYLNQLVSVYPNPANNVLNLKIPSDDFNTTVSDNTGRVVMNSNSNRLDISELNPGMYFVAVEVDNTIVIKRFVKN